MGFAQINLNGNLGNEPETRYTPNGAMNVQFSLAVNTFQGTGKDDATTWYRVTAWGDMAERLDKLTQKGSLQKGYSLYVTGNFLPRNWTDNAGTERISYDVKLTAFEFVGGRSNGTTERVDASTGEITTPESEPRVLSADDF